MRRQFDESLRVTTMSMDLGMDKSEDESEDENEGDRSASEVGHEQHGESFIEAQEPEERKSELAGGNWLATEQDRDADGRSEVGYDEESDFNSSYFDSVSGNDIGRSNTVAGHEQYGESFIEAQDPGELRSELEGGKWLATERVWNAESAVVYSESASLGE